MKVVVMHNLNGTTKTASFEAPHISSQMIDGGINLTLLNEDRSTAGFAQFTTAGIVTVAGSALEQYQGMSRTVTAHRPGAPDA